MAFIISSREGNKPLRIYYEDMGKGPAIVFIAGWPLTHQMWEYQVTPLREKGYRCITYDRRGFGQSDQSLNDYDYDALAVDLHALLEALDLNNVVLVGFSMGGGEVIRYLTNYGSVRIRKIVLVSAVIPYMLQTNSNPEGVPAEVFDEFEEKIRADRPAFLSSFGKDFYGVSLMSHPVSQELLDWTQSLALTASQKGMIDCMKAFSQTDFRQEVGTINLPALVIHGDHDKTVPMEATSQRAATLLPYAKLTIYEGAPHGLFITHHERLVKDLCDFIESEADAY